MRLAPDLARALGYARGHGLRAFIVTRGDETLACEFDDGVDRATPHPLYSGTKSFWGVLALCAQDDGLLALDEPVAATIASWSDDPWKRRVTPRMLLALTSGFGFGGLGASVPTYERALAIPLRDEPGSRFTYGGIPLQVFGAVLARKLERIDETPHEYLRRRVLVAAGVEIAAWRSLSDETQPLPTGASLSAGNWLAYGRFIIDHWDRFAECFSGSAVNPRYGLGWWLGGPGRPADIAYASGSGGQGLYLVPSLDLCVVHFGKSSSYRHEVFLRRLINYSA